VGAYTPARTSGVRPIAFLGLAGVIYLDDDPAVPVRNAHVSAWGWWLRDVAIPVTSSERVATLAEHFDIVWASEWGHNAHTAFREALGLPDEPWPSLPVQFDKLGAIRSYAQGLPWMWIDDPLVITPGPVADELGVIVRTDPHRGLAALDIAALRRDVSERIAR